MDFNIDKKRGTPVYRQLVEEITRRVKAGELLPGDQLPPERELAAALNVARGTVKRAYERLADNHILDVGHGRGTFVSARQDVVPVNRKERAVALMRQLVGELTHLKFSYDEIRSLFQVVLEDSRQLHENLQIAAVDCNPESLATFEQQLRHISHLQIHKYPLELFESNPDAVSQLDSYDLVLTTATHYEELVGFAPKLAPRLLQVVLSTSQQTIIDLANLSRQEKIGVLTNSRNFQNIIREKLQDFFFDLPRANCLFERERGRLGEFLRDKTVLIVPPGFVPRSGGDEGNALREFTLHGGRIIRFEYQIERAALLYIEQRVSELMARKADLAME